jgi:hypothetical protein
MVIVMGGSRQTLTGGASAGAVEETVLVEVVSCRAVDRHSHEVLVVMVMVRSRVSSQ